MKTAVIILSVLSGLLLIGAGFLLVQNRKLKKAGSPDIASEVQRFVDSLPIYLSDVDAKAHGLVAGGKYRLSATATDYRIVAA